MRNTVVSSDAAFNKDPFSINFGRGKAGLSFRPISFDGSIAASELAIGFNSGEIGAPGDPKPVKPLEQVRRRAATADQAASSACSTGCPRSSCSTSPPRRGAVCRT